MIIKVTINKINLLHDKRYENNYILLIKKSTKWIYMRVCVSVCRVCDPINRIHFITRFSKELGFQLYFSVYHGLYLPQKIWFVCWWWCAPLKLLISGSQGIKLDKKRIKKKNRKVEYNMIRINMNKEVQNYREIIYKYNYYASGV